MTRMMLRKYRPHHCEQGIRSIKDYQTPKTRDDLIYLFEGEKFNFYKVKHVVGDGTYECNELNVEKKEFKRHPELDFDRVGVF